MNDREKEGRVSVAEPLDAPLFKANPMRGYREDWQRSKNLDGTIPTKEAHYWVMHPCEAFANACTAHAACGERSLHYDAERRLLNDPSRLRLCPACEEWALQRLLAGYPVERDR